jgi:hypothetical protein
MNVETFNKHITESILKSHIIESGGYKKLKIKHTDLKAIYEKNNWLSDFDEYEKDEFQKEPQRNKLNVFLSRVTHKAYHLGQIALLAK